jgi:SAM-dependent methyltransferase
MRTNFPCPICRASDWRDVETFHFRASDHAMAGQGRFGRVVSQAASVLSTALRAAPRTRPVSHRRLTRYHALRRRILFDLWFPGQDDVTLTSSYCLGCGFMAYSPRPTHEDLRAKYEALSHAETDRCDGPSHAPLAQFLDQERARRVFRAVAPVLGQGAHTVLDYGGGDGRLLAPFVERGWEGAVVDYYDRQKPGVRKIADDLDGMPPNLGFEVILCNHVLEHLADPRQLVAALRRLLCDGGILYAEVPMEIWGGLPRIAVDPVTHCNFFTFESLRALFSLTGYDVLGGGRCIATVGRSAGEIVWILCRKGETTGSEPSLEGSKETEACLYPPRIRSAQRIARLATLEVANRIRHLISRG